MKFPENLKEAKKVQLELKNKVKIISLKKKPGSIAGVDAAFSGNNIIAVACLYKYPGLLPVEDAYSITKVSFPYIPGYLSFREGPAIIKAINKLKTRPDIILFDGQGTAHPHGMGIASHIGVLLDIPSIGCAKSRLVGDYKEPGNIKGEHSKLTYKQKTVGAVLRTRKNVKPLFISPGHLIDLKGALDIVINCTGRYRIPEPLRRADLISKKLKQGTA